MPKHMIRFKDFNAERVEYKSGLVEYIIENKDLLINILLITGFVSLMFFVGFIEANYGSGILDINRQAGWIESF